MPSLSRWLPDDAISAANDAETSAAICDTVHFPYLRPASPLDGPRITESKDQRDGLWLKSEEFQSGSEEKKTERLIYYDLTVRYVCSVPFVAKLKRAAKFSQSLLSGRWHSWHEALNILIAI